MRVIRSSSLIPGLVAVLALCACRGVPSQTTQRRPIQQMPAVVYADAIPVADFRAVCDALARDLVVQPFITRSDRPPVVTIRKLQNKTDVDLDEEIFQETIRVKLVEHAQGSVLFRDDASYRDIVEERLRSSGNEIEISITDSRVDTQSTDRFRDLEYEAGSLSGSRLDNQRSAMREDETEVEMEQSGSVSARVAEVDYFLRGLVYQVREPDARNPKQGMNYFQYQFRVVDARNGIIVWEKMLDGKLEGEYMPLKKKSRSGTGALGAPPNYFPQNPQPQTQTPGTPPAPWVPHPTTSRRTPSLRLRPLARRRRPGCPTQLLPAEPPASDSDPRHTDPDSHRAAGTHTVMRFHLLFPALIGALLVAGATRAAEDLSLTELENRKTFLTQRILDQERAIEAMKAERRAAEAESRLPTWVTSYAANQPRPSDPPWVRGLLGTLRPQESKPEYTGGPLMVYQAAVFGSFGLDEQRARAFKKLLEDELARIEQEINAIDLFGGTAPAAAAAVVKQLRIDTTFPEIAPGATELFLEEGGTTHLKARAQLERGDHTWWQDWTTHVHWQSDSAGVSVSSSGAVQALRSVGGLVTIRARSDASVAEIPLRVIRPAISIAKTSIPPGAIFDTDTDVSFEFEVTNTGDRRLFDVDVQDSVCSPVTTSSGTAILDVGTPPKSLTFTCTMKVKRTAALPSTASVWARYQPSGLRNYVTATTTHTLDVRQGPQITFVSHGEGDRVTTSTIVLRGTASDAGRGDNGVHAVLVDSSQANAGSSTGGTPVDWSKEVGLKAGKNKFMVEAYDGAPDFNLTRRYINLYYDPPAAPSDPSLVDLLIQPNVDSLDVGQQQTFVAIAVYQNGTTVDVTNADETRWVPGNPVQPDTAGPFEVTVIYKGRMATILIGVEGPPPAPPGGGPQDPDGLPGGIFNILFKPDGTGRPRCFQFMLARVGGDFLASPGVLTPAATRSGWSVDNFAGAGPYQGWTWADPLRANARMMDLSVYGGDWYGCRQPPQWVPPAVGTGQVSPIPPGMPEYGIWRRNRLNSPPNCFEFAAAPLTEAERYDGKNGYVREPSFFGPWAQIDVSKITSQLSPYEGDFYRCFTGPTPVSLSIDPSSAEIPWGGSLALVATAVNDDGSTTDVTAEASWSHALPIQGDVPGTYLVTATYQGLEASAQVTVLPPRLTGLVVTTDAPEIHQGQTAYFRAIASFEDGSERDVTDDADWHPNSWVNPTNLDPITARATYRGLTASQTVMVVATPPAQTASFQIVNVLVSGIPGGSPVKGNPVMVNAEIQVGSYDGLAAWECRRASDGHYGPGVQITSVSAGARIPVRCEFPELPLEGHPFGDAITITVSDGGDVTESLNAPFSWQDSDTFTGLAFEDIRSGRGGQSFDVGAQVRAISSWKIDPYGGSSRVIRYMVGGQIFHEEPVGVTPGSDFTHTAPLIPITRSMKGSLDIQVLLVRADGDRQVGGAKLRVELPEDEILSAAVLTGQGGSITAGATAFVAVQVRTAEGLEGARTLELQGRGRGSLGVESFSSQGGEVVSKSLMIDTTGQDPGTHRLKVVLTDPGGNSDRTQTSYTIVEPPAQAPSRRTGGLTDVVCQDGNISVSVRDHKTLDGDIISVALGNDLVTSGLNLDSCGGGCLLRNVTLAPGEALPLSVLAHNTGSYGPNTAELSVQGSCSPTTQPWELQTNESAAIWIRRP